MKYITMLLFVGFIAAVVSAQTTNHTWGQGIEVRKNKILHYYATPDGKVANFFQIAARLRLGQNIEKCRKDFMIQLENPSGDMFYSLPMMGCYLYGYDYWTSEIHQKAKQVWQTYWPYRGDTENHWVMWHTALLLAAQTWPDMTADKWINGRSSQENYEDAQGLLNSWLEIATTIGQGEFDSPHYLQVYLGSLFVLYEFVRDPVMKQKAEMALNWLLADYAGDYLGGAYTGGHSRVYDQDILDPSKDGSVGFGYIFFGDTPFPKNASLSFTVFAALSGYRLPEVIQRIATDRDKPYVSFEKKRVRNIIRFDKEMNPPVYKTNYMSKNFSLGCLDGGLQQPIQIHTWGVTYLYDDRMKADELFSLHPYYSYKELGMFFPEKLKVMVSEVIKSKGTYNKEDKWTGGSPYERTFQHKNCIIVLYNLDAQTPFKHIDYYFPKSLKKREEGENGWIFCRGGEAYIAVRPLQPGTWHEEKTCFRFRSPHLQNGVITEVFESADFKSWQDFKDSMERTKLDLSKLESQVKVKYTTSSGDEMKFRFPDRRYLNGKFVDLSKMPLFDSPYLEGNDRVLKVKHGKEEIILDFNKEEIIKKVH
ncbi:MAG TPA: hypothetical protein ENH29_01165 [Bacteroidetes bacterium]|nr:hypothetical protein [Bacteroidota bacterium]